MQKSKIMIIVLCGMLFTFFAGWCMGNYEATKVTVASFTNAVSPDEPGHATTAAKDEEQVFQKLMKQVSALNAMRLSVSLPSLLDEMACLADRAKRNLLIQELSAKLIAILNTHNKNVRTFADKAGTAEKITVSAADTGRGQENIRTLTNAQEIAFAIDSLTYDTLTDEAIERIKFFIAMLKEDQEQTALLKSLAEKVYVLNGADDTAEKTQAHFVGDADNTSADIELRITDLDLRTREGMEELRSLMKEIIQLTDKEKAKTLLASLKNVLKESKDTMYRP